MELRPDWISLYLHAGKKRVLLGAAALTVCIALADAWIIPDVSLGILYVVPILAAGFFLDRRQIVAAAFVCTMLREIFATGALTGLRALLAGTLFTEGVVTRDVLIFLTFLVSGLFISEVSLNRRLISRHLAEVREQTDLRRRAEEELGVVVDTSPAAIFIVDREARIIQANASSYQLLGLTGEALEGKSIAEFLPALATIPEATADVHPLRSHLECRGRRADGGSFLGQVWLSTYYTPQGPRMAAIVLDTSESLRDRESGGLRALMLTSRILMGAVSHSVRNLCAAARVAYANLQRDPVVAVHDDFQALGTLIRGLESIASADLNRAAERQISTVDPNTLLDELRIVIEPAFEEAGIEIQWDVPEKLPTVMGQHYGLLHALLNLAQNSQRALEPRPGARRLAISARAHGGTLTLRLEDNGGGVPAPERLFQPFQPDAEGTGMGAYVARSVVRAFDGDLSYEPVPGGSAFIMELNNASDSESYANRAAN